jgi:hypothetical protein
LYVFDRYDGDNLPRRVSVTRSLPKAARLMISENCARAFTVLTCPIKELLLLTPKCCQWRELPGSPLMRLGELQASPCRNAFWSPGGLDLPRIPAMHAA